MKKTKPVSHYNLQTFKKPQNPKDAKKKMAKLPLVDVVTVHDEVAYAAADVELSQQLKEKLNQIGHNDDTFPSTTQNPCAEIPLFGGTTLSAKYDYYSQNMQNMFMRRFQRLDSTGRRERAEALVYGSPSLPLPPHRDFYRPPSFYQQEEISPRVRELVKFAEDEVDLAVEPLRAETYQLRDRNSCLYSQVNFLSEGINGLAKEVKQLKAELEETRRNRILVQERQITMTERVRHFRLEEEEAGAG